MRYRVLRLLGILLVLPLCGASVFGGSLPKKRPNVIMILVDTLRADHLGCYGFKGGISPATDEFAAESVLFERCASPAPWTKPSVASLFTSLYPEIHGVVNDRWPPDPSAPVSTEILPAEAETMAENFRTAGYQTVAFFSNDWIEDPYGFSQGFARFQFEKRGWVNAAVDKWAPGVSTATPFFLYVHVMDVHGEYEFDWADFDNLKNTIPSEYDRPLTAEERRDIHAYMLNTWPPARKELGDNVLNWRAAYSSAVKRYDSRLSGLIRTLKEKNLYDDSIVVLLADHGEGLMDHGHLDHGDTQNIEEIHVPLMVRLPGGRNAHKRVPEWISLLDVLPTLAELTGLPNDTRWQGISLVRALSSGHAPERAQFSTASHDRRERSVVDGRFHLITFEGKPPRLYNVKADPRERMDIAEKNPATVAKMKQLLQDHQDAMKKIPLMKTNRAPVSDEVQEQLRSLGYLQ